MLNNDFWILLVFFISTFKNDPTIDIITLINWLL